MKKYRIEYEGWDSLKEDTGDDFVTFVCNVYPEGKNESFFVSIAFFELKKRLQELDPNIFAIIEKVEKSIKKWGMHDSDTIYELEECGINVSELVVKVIEKTCDLEKEEIHKANYKASIGTNEVANIFKDLQESAFGMKTDTENYILICTRIEKILTTEMMELFPVIFNSSSENILEFEEILVRHIPVMAEDLCGLIRNTRE